VDQFDLFAASARFHGVRVQTSDGDARLWRFRDVEENLPATTTGTISSVFKAAIASRSGSER